MSNTEEKKLYVQVIKKKENEYEIAGISEDRFLWYRFSDEFCNIKQHKNLLSKTPIKSAIKSIKSINGTRKIAVKLDGNLKREYFDEDGNFCYKDFSLEEIEVCSVRESENEIILTQKIKELESRLNTNNEIKIYEVEKKFVLGKFDKKQNSSEWFASYELECSRHKIIESSQKIEALKFFVIGSVEDWYKVNLTKIGLNNWSEWKKSFLNVFVDKGWTIVRRAYSYKYLNGSLIDYALAKERLCLEAERGSTEITRIQMIVFGLPLEVQVELDREEITTITKLFEELRKVEDLIKKNKILNNSNKKIEYSKGKIDEGKKKQQHQLENLKRPCQMCQTLGWPERYHSPTECRNKELYATKKKINLTEIEENLNERDDFFKIDIDENSLN
ncbi:hypothetical protein ABEB36_009346 [Hypothenemus hampei]|uniref:Uncharacterized protein n=1 Tax=Hypothenemus hampei TaxID=57062 RepID=A0ABD1EG27_HYPHA